MKKIFLAFAALLITANLYADDKGKSSLYFEPISLKGKHQFFKKNCDLCACYLGIDPNYNMNTVGVRFSRFAYSRDAIAPVSNPNLDHEGHGGTGEVKETYDNYELFGKYYINPALRISFNIPFSSNTIDGKSIKDISDMTFLAQYQLYNTEVDGDTKFRHRIFAGGGIKLPTGSYDKSLVPGVLDPHAQAGTGSFDFLLNTSYMAWLSGVGFSTDIIYTVNTANKFDYLFANRLNVTSSFFYKMEKGHYWSFIPHAGVYLETAGNDKQNGAEVSGTSSNSFFATGGLDVYFRQLSVNFTYQHPVSQSFGASDHPENDNRYFIGLGYSF